MQVLRISSNGRHLLKNLEGIRLSPYRCSAGKLTVGVGHVLSVVERMTLRFPLTEQKVEQLLDQDLIRFEQVVNRSVMVELNQNQFDALVLFSFNVGTDAFRGSTLLHLLNAGNYNQAAVQLKRWCKVTDPITKQLRVEPGLLNRRTEEYRLFLRPISSLGSDVPQLQAPESSTPPPAQPQKA